MPTSTPSSSILLIDPAPDLCKIVHQNFPTTVVNVCSSFLEATIYIPLHVYQVVICPQKLASREQSALLNLNQRHNPCAPFIVTTKADEVADVRQAIDQGALGFLHGSTTTSNIVRIIQELLSLYRLRFSLAHRTRWAANFRHQLRKPPTHETWQPVSGAKRENRGMRKQTLTAIEGSLAAFRAKANTLISKARQTMWDY